MYADRDIIYSILQENRLLLDNQLYLVSLDTFS